MVPGILVPGLPVARTHLCTTPWVPYGRSQLSSAQQQGLCIISTRWRSLSARACHVCVGAMCAWVPCGMAWPPDLFPPHPTFLSAWLPYEWENTLGIEMLIVLASDQCCTHVFASWVRRNSLRPTLCVGVESGEMYRRAVEVQIVSRLRNR